MPAVTADPLTLERIRQLPESEPARRVRGIVDSIRTFEGEGFPVKRPFPGIDHKLTDPFILLDQLGEVDYAPGEAKGAPDHPHRGFETVTYVMDGEMEHKDSTGGGGLITNGSTQWMTAGAGIVHSEMPPEALVMAGGLFHGVQLWVNLPKADKWLKPKYQDIEADAVKLIASSDGASLVRIIAGDVDGHKGPGGTHTPITYLHASIAPGARLALPWRDDFNALVYALIGSGSVGGERVKIEEGQLAVFEGAQAGTRDSAETRGEATSRLVISADEAQPSSAHNFEVLVLGGRPIGEPIVAHGPFVMNTRAEIVEAIDDFQSGKMGSIPATRA